MRRGRARAAPRARRGRRATRRAGRPGPHAVGHRHHPGRARPGAARPHPGGARRRGPGRHARPGRQLVDQPGRLGEQGRGVGGARARRLVRRRPRDDPALARAADRPAPGAGHRRDQPRRAARRAGRHLVPLGAAAAADRGALRPVRRARAGALVVRDLRGRAVDPGRHAVRGDAGAGGRRAPVDLHAVGRAGAARLRHLRAGVRDRGRVDAARVAGPAGPPGRHVGVPAAVDPARRPGARGRAGGPGRPRAAPAPGGRGRLPAAPAATGARPGRDDRRDGRDRARGAGRGGPARRASGTPRTSCA